MKLTLKAFALLSLSCVMATRVSSNRLIQSSYHAVATWPCKKLKRKEITRISVAVESLLTGPINPQFILSMLIAGLSDIEGKCKPRKRILIQPVIIDIQQALDQYPDDIDHEEAYERYLKWL